MDNLEAFSQQGRKAISDKNWQYLAEVVREVFAEFPEEAESHFLLGKLLSAQNNIKGSTHTFEQVLAIDPERYDAAIELAHLYTISRRNKDAYSLVQKYQDKIDKSPVYLSAVGMVYDNIGMPEEANEFHNKAFELQPDLDSFKTNLAISNLHLGKLSEAKSLYEDLIEKNPEHQRHHYFFSRLGEATNDEHIKQMLQTVEASGQSDERNIYINYALAKEYEDLKQWSSAFEHYKVAGDAATKVSNYDVSEDINIVNTIIEHCSQEWLNARADTTRIVSGPAPIFIVGLPRTGTTLLERILSSHNSVTSVGETQFLPMLIREFSGMADTRQISSEIIQGACKNDVTGLAQRYFDGLEYRMDRSKDYVIEKLPYNFLYVAFIKKAFPNAKIIYMDRNPMDACFSMYKQVFTWAYKYSYDLDNLATYYTAHNKLLDHWRALLGDDLIEVAYEKLVTDSENTVSELFRELKLEFQPKVLEFYKRSDASTTASSVQVRKKIHSNSVEQWRNFEQELQPLKQKLEANGIICD